MASQEKPPQPKTFTGVVRKRTSRPSVKVFDRVAYGVIMIGGLGTIIAVLLVGIDLFMVAVPLFYPPEVSPRHEIESSWADGPLIRTGIDEYRSIGWALGRDGRLRVFRADDGQLIDTIEAFDGQEVTCWSFATAHKSAETTGGGGSDKGSALKDSIALGYRDGSVQFGTLDYTTEFLRPEQLSEAIRQMTPGETLIYEKGLVEAQGEERFRARRLRLTMDDPIKIQSSSSARLIDHVVPTTGPMLFAVLHEDGSGSVGSVRKQYNALLDETVTKFTGGPLTIPGDRADPPAHLLMTGLGNSVFALWKDGQLLRFDTRDRKQVELAEMVDVLPDTDAQVTAVTFMPGRATLMVGDGEGGLSGWFEAKPKDNHLATPDGIHLYRGHVLPEGPAEVTALAAGVQSRTCGVGYGNGDVRLIQVTAERVLVDVSAGEGRVDTLALGAKDNGLMASTPDNFATWSYELGHHEVTLGTLFGPVWYEGYAEPQYTWQSSAGADAAEPKLGLMPLIFGTLKATFYSILIGAPLALLAAIYTSEFLTPKIKARVKPTIEMMASLPSVVLGFLAALVIAPIVSVLLPAVLFSFATIPLSLLTAAFLWQMIGHKISLQISWLRLPLMFAAIVLGVVLAWRGGPVVDNLLFAGDIKRWLDGQVGSGLPGWFVLLLPVTGVATAIGSSLFVGPVLRSISHDWSRRKMAMVDLIKYLALIAIAALSSLLLAWLLSGCPVGSNSLLSVINFYGIDPRGSLLGTYDQRNSLIVGFVMGFAIIPIIYTIADDALSSVPDYLRSGSLASGATPWQTAVRVVVPTAMSGLFSACMIGLGRAVGETMIVLMAVGNTPILDVNIFNGFRTLAANIAVELPEAPKDTTHFRTLFLTALVLFLMTFCINTVAEIVRQRFRRRAYEL